MLFLAHCKAEVLIGSRHFPVHPVLCHGVTATSTSSLENHRTKMLLRLAGAFRNASSAGVASPSRVLRGVRSGSVAHLLIHFWDNSQQHL